MTELLKTALSEEHRALGAKMGPYANYEMPLQYSSIKDEVNAVRGKTGVFDVSHMGEFFINGPEASKFVDYLICNEFLSVEIGKAVYSPLCREDGTVIDDVICYKLNRDRVMICVNAANRKKDFDWINSQLKNFNCSLSDQSDDYSLLAIQGPGTNEVLKKLNLTELINKESFSVTELNKFEGKIIVAKTGYTGEVGVEVFCSHKTALNLWRDLMALDVCPCGLVARDVLRLEACFPLYGQEIHDQVTPLDSALKWTVKLSKESFVGKDALANYKPRLKLIKLILDKGVPRPGFKVFSEGREVGVITSGTMSVTLGKGIALAHVSVETPKETENFEIQVRNKFYDAKKTMKAFIKG